MDLLFKRYASPYEIVDNMIACNRFCEFIDELLEIKKSEDEDEQDKLLWHFWLHNVESQTFADWKAESKKPEKTAEMQAEEMEATVKESKSILDGFIPS